MARGNPPLQIRVDDARRARWQASADRAGMTLLDWLRALADEASESAGGKVARKAAPSRVKSAAGPRGDLDRRDVQTFFKS
jgi:hypothetical protein